MWNKKNLAQFEDCIKDLGNTQSINDMRNISQHVNINCFEHSMFVSYASFLVCRFLHLDYVAAARGGLLHDLFLYDWREKGSHTGRHLFSHPRVALKNASSLFLLSDKEKDIIEKHMWPLTLKMPKYKESVIVNLVDTLCAGAEMIFVYKAMNVKNNLKTIYA